MNAEAIQEIANQLGITVSSVTLWVYSPYGSFINYILN